MANGNLFYNETLSISYGTVSLKEITIDLMAMPMNVKFPKPTVIIIIIIIIIIIMLRLETSECVSQS